MNAILAMFSILTKRFNTVCVLGHINEQRDHAHTNTHMDEKITRKSTQVPKEQTKESLNVCLPGVNLDRASLILFLQASSAFLLPFVGLPGSPGGRMTPAESTRFTAGIAAENRNHHLWKHNNTTTNNTKQ